KVALDVNGNAEIAFTVPSAPEKFWKKIETSLPAASRQLILKDDQAISEKLFKNQKHDRVYLNQAGFSAILNAFSSSKDYESKVTSLEFHELYVPVTVIPEVAAHFRRYAHLYAYDLVAKGSGLVTYINLNEGKFIQGAGAALKAGYVITIDY